eukprot:9071386-Alexandrium_andersonii.AAC.1
MSASLVGSEMCIRDRCSPPRGATQAGRRRHVGVLAASASDIRHGPGGPVSYTHLTLPTICSV